jgi:glycosyltransferase involved in cell wall biosynthesis
VPAHAVTGQRLHVLFLNTQPSVRADVSVHVSLAGALDRQATRVSVATSLFETPGGESARVAFGQIPDLTLLPLDLGRPYSTERGLGRLTSALGNARGATTLLSLARWCRRERVAIVHVTERPRDVLFGLVLARLSGCKLLVHAHTTYYAHPRSRGDVLVEWALARANALVGVSQFTAASYWKHGIVARTRVHAVHNAVATTVLERSVAANERSAMRARLGLPDDVPVVGSVGRLMRWKNQDILVAAFATVRQQVPNARLVIAGSAADSAPDGPGDYRDYLVRQATELGLLESVTFTGFVTPAEVPALYAAFDVFAHPCAEEPFGLVIVEAMASNRPVVAVNAGGVPEIIRDGVDGLLVPPQQSDALAQAVVRLLGDREVANRLVDSARTRVNEAFTPRAQADAMLGVYRSFRT